MPSYEMKNVLFILEMELLWHNLLEMVLKLKCEVFVRRMLFISHLAA